MSKVPAKVLEETKSHLWRIADDVEWLTLTDNDKSNLYEQWIADDSVGAVLSRYIDRANVRVYIKDTIMKPYTINRLDEPAKVFRYFEIADVMPVAKVFIKPHGRLFRDGKLISWGPARNWKAILFSLFERSYEHTNATPFGAALIHPVGKLRDRDYQGLVAEAAARFEIKKLVFIDD